MQVANTDPDRRCVRIYNHSGPALVILCICYVCMCVCMAQRYGESSRSLSCHITTDYYVYVRSVYCSRYIVLLILSPTLSYFLLILSNFLIPTVNFFPVSLILFSSIRNFLIFKLRTNRIICCNIKKIYFTPFKYKQIRIVV